MSAFKRFAAMLLNIVAFLATFYAASMIHDHGLVKVKAYTDFQAKNPTMWIISVLTIGFVLLILLHAAKRLIFGSDGFAKAAHLRGFAPSLLLPLTVIGFSCAFLFICLVKISYLQENFPALDNYVDIFMGDSFLITLLGVAVVGAVYEETLFRGLILSQLWKAKVHFVPALVVHALLYAYFQPSVPISFVAFFLATLYTLLFYKIRSVLVSIYVAALLNALLVTAKKTGVYESIGDWHDALLHAGVLASLAVIVGMLVYVYRSGETRKPGQQAEPAASI